LREKYPLLSGGFVEENAEIIESEKRAKFFMVSAISMVIVAILGAHIMGKTDSDMVMIDVWDMLADIAGLSLSFLIERFKQQAIRNRHQIDPLQSRRSVLFFDVCGGLVSFLLLLIVVVTGTYVSAEKVYDPVFDMVHRRWLVLSYSLLSMCGDAVPLIYFRHTISSVAGEDANKLNILSGVLHMAIDLLRALVTFVTGIYMLLDPQRLDDNMADGIGAAMICILVLCSSIYVANEAVNSFRELNDIDNQIRVDSACGIGGAFNNFNKL